MLSVVKSFVTLESIEQLAESCQFKTWFLDQFGVFHDVKRLYPGAIGTMERLAAYAATLIGNHK